jgi:cation/acetate symporter
VIYEPSLIAIVIFFLFVGITLGISFYMGRKAQSSEGYFAAHGQIPWFVNGVAFAGDYLSAASFLGICGMIAFYGYDGFLYSIGFLAGWIVALFVVAEPMKRLGKFTFADALNAKFQSPGIKIAAGISTLAVSIFYLIPQMVGAGVLVQPLLGFEHWVGVVIVGAVVILIVVTAGMVSTTWVQFLKGSLLVLFSAILTVMILSRGFEIKDGGADGYQFRNFGPFALKDFVSSENPGSLGPAMSELPEFAGAEVLFEVTGKLSTPAFVRSGSTFWAVDIQSDSDVYLRECQTQEIRDGRKISGQEFGSKASEDAAPAQLHPIGYVSKLPGDQQKTGPLGPISFFTTMQESEVVLWKKKAIAQHPGLDIYVPTPKPGSQVLRPGEHPKFAGIRKPELLGKLNFLSLMLALFCGTASLPHILIRYYTVKDAAAARKSTIVGIASIGFFYVLTLYMGLGAMTSGAMDVTDSNMAAPLLARSMSEFLFAAISAIAFTTVLGTVSGLILASAGAVTHDLMSNFVKTELTSSEQVRLAKIASVFVGLIAIVLGILFKGMNVGYLVGWAFSVAASANLPALVMLLFWKGTTRQGIIAAIIVGMVSSLGWILLSADTFKDVYGLPAEDALVPFSQPGIVTIPLGFLTLVVVSLLTKPEADV